MIETMEGIFWSIKKMVTCILQSVPLQTCTVFLTLKIWWLIRCYSFCRRFQWTRMQFCLTFQISWRTYPTSSMRYHLSWHTIFRFMNSKLVLHCIFDHTLRKYHLINQTPMTSQETRFVTHKYSPKMVSKQTKEDNDASLLAMENRLFDRLMDVRASVRARTGGCGSGSSLTHPRRT
jgi:hypothetical protein